MATIPKRVEERLIAGLKKFQTVLTAAKSRDVNESDLVVILNDICAEVFGYDKYFEITSEFAIRGTFCDLAIKLENKIQVLIEAKAPGIELKDPQVKQAIDYAANQGVDWVVLTNGLQWRIYKVIFAKPIGQELVCEFDFLTLSPKNEEHLQLLYLLTKEGWAKSAVGDFHQQKQALSRFFVGAIVLTEPVLAVMRRELKRLSPDVRIDTDQIAEVLRQEVIKREVLDGEKFTEAVKQITRSANKQLRAEKKDAGPTSPPLTESAAHAETPAPKPLN